MKASETPHVPGFEGESGSVVRTHLIAEAAPTASHDWAPLTKIYGPEGAAAWMFMGFAEAVVGCAKFPPVKIHLFKNRDTRHYLNLDATGRAYRFQHRGDGIMAYEPIPLREAVRWAEVQE